MNKWINISSEKFKNKKVISECKTASLQHTTEFSSLGILFKENHLGSGAREQERQSLDTLRREAITECSSVSDCLVTHFQKGFKSKARMPSVLLMTLATIMTVVILVIYQTHSLLVRPASKRNVRGYVLKSGNRVLVPNSTTFLSPKASVFWSVKWG